MNSLLFPIPKFPRWSLTAILVCLAALATVAATTDETQVPPFTLPDPLVMADGPRITTAAQWAKHRPDLLELMRREMYGQAPARPAKMRFEVFDRDPRALEGKATREQVTVFFTGEAAGPKMDLLIYRPNGLTKPAPAILGLNFWGNHAIHRDPGIRITTNWMESGRNPYVDLAGVKDHAATEACRGVNARQWPVEKILAHGYALVTAYRGDIARDDGQEAFHGGVFPAFPELLNQGDNFALVGAWAWALSRALDYLETNPAIDARRVAVFGWSRLGKASLWAGASDERFALVIAHESGAGGAALSKRLYGEDVERLNRVFPHWYCANFRKYSAHEDQLPFDQHEVIALVAPRPVYIGSAVDDTGADPRGEFLAAKAAEPVYRLFGDYGLPAESWPAPNAPAHGRIAYHLRPGNHDVTEYDWEQYLAFADQNWRR
jgi:hypothetical protein